MLKVTMTLGLGGPTDAYGHGENRRQGVEDGEKVK